MNLLKLTRTPHQRGLAIVLALGALAAVPAVTALNIVLNQIRGAYSASGDMIGIGILDAAVFSIAFALYLTLLIALAYPKHPGQAGLLQTDASLWGGLSWLLTAPAIAAVAWHMRPWLTLSHIPILLTHAVLIYALAVLRAMIGVKQIPAARTRLIDEVV